MHIPLNPTNSHFPLPITPPLNGHYLPHYTLLINPGLSVPSYSPTPQRIITYIAPAAFFSAGVSNIKVRVTELSKARAGFKPATFRTKVAESTNEPPRPTKCTIPKVTSCQHYTNYTGFLSTLKSSSSRFFSSCIISTLEPIPPT